MKCYFDLFFRNWTIEIMHFVIYLFCIVFYIEFYQYNKSVVPISFPLSHQRSLAVPWPFRSYILTIRNWWTWSKRNKQQTSRTNVTIGTRNRSINSYIHQHRLLTFYSPKPQGLFLDSILLMLFRSQCTKI